MPRKRSNGEGSIYQDPSHPKSPWVAAWTHEGKTHRKRFPTQAEARAHLTGVQAAIQRGEYAAPDRMTVGDWLAAYMRDVAPLLLKPASLKLEQDYVQRILLPTLGNRRLQDPRLRDHIQTAVRKLSEKYAPSTVRRIFSVLHKALKEAVRRRYIAYNPADDMVLPKQQKSHVKACTSADAMQLLTALPDTSNGRALHFALLTGLRVSEVCALRWQDVEADAFHVNHTMSDGVLSEPKTSAGKRTVHLTGELRELLRVQRVHQLEERLRAGSAWKDGDFVFATALGTPADRNNIKRTCERAAEKAGIPHTTPHALRHTFATVLLEQQTSIGSVAAMMGHTDPAFTLRQYVNSDPAAEQAGMEAISNIFR